MLNAGRVNSDLTGINSNLWAILMYMGVFLIWNNYRETDKNFFTLTGLKLAGMGILIFLVLKFQSGEPENNGSLITGWWGILGLIGWGYLVAALIYLWIRDSILKTTTAFLFFLLMNILSNLNLLSFLDIAKPIFGVLIEGNVPMIIIAGMITTQVLKKYSGTDSRKAIVTIVTIGAATIIAGFILRNWFIISKIQATPSWGMICIGISMILFALLFWIIDIRKKTRWSFIFKPAGENSLTAYLAPDIIYYLIWSSGFNILIYKSSGLPVVAIIGSVIWAFLMVGLTSLLVRFGIKLKL
jgi:predicted acyltransferase